MSLIEHVRMTYAAKAATSPCLPPESAEYTAARRAARAKWRDILTEVAAKYGLSEEALLGPRRWRSMAWPRQELMYRMRTETPLSWPEIGRRLGGRDHTTCLYGARAHARRLEHGPPVSRGGTVERACGTCATHFFAPQSLVLTGRAKFCSVSCANKAKRVRTKS